MPIEVDANNPLGLTVAGPGYGTPGAILYPGQSGDVTSGLGYDFATFPDQQTGIAAGIDYIQRKISSGAVNTVQGLVNLFSPNDLAPFEQQTGLGPFSPLDPAQAGTYAAGIAAGEGTLAAFGGPAAFTGSASGNTSSVPANGGASAVGGNSGASGSGDPLGFQKAVSGLETWFGEVTGSVTFVILGFVLIGGAIIIFANQSGVTSAVRRGLEAAA